MICVSTFGQHAGAKDTAARQRCEKMAASRQAQMVTEAEFVWDRIRAVVGAWRTADRQAGGPPPGVAGLAELSVAQAPGYR